MIVIIDYGRGNLFSIEQALRHLRADYSVSGDPALIAGANRLILPGVGAFGDAMQTLFARGLVEPIRQSARRGIPLLGICLGMQLLFERSVEFGEHAGLALIKGSVGPLPSGDMRVPNVGWRKLVPNLGNKMLEDVESDTMVYFVHSFVARPADPSVVAATIPFNGENATIAVASGNIAGYQFHPEKSGHVGLALLEKFVSADI